MDIGLQFKKRKIIIFLNNGVTFEIVLVNQKISRYLAFD